MNNKSLFLNKLNFIFDIVIYCTFYICFLVTLYPLLSDLIAYSGTSLPQYTIFFWKIAWFCEHYFYIPIFILIIIGIWCTRYTCIFDSWKIQFMMKCIGTIFFLGTMITLSPSFISIAPSIPI